MRLLLAIALLVATPAAATPATLHWHTVDGYQDGVLSTQSPSTDHAAVNGFGSQAFPNCRSLGLPVGIDVLSWSAFTSVSGAFYERNADGDAYLFGSAGVAGDIHLGTRKASLHWVLATGNVSGAPDGGIAPGVTLTVDLLRPTHFADETPPTRIGGGSVGPILLAGDATQDAAHTVIGTRHVYDFDVPLTFDDDMLPVGERDSYGGGPPLRVDVHLTTDLPCDGVAPTPLLLFSGDGHRPALQLDVVDPITVEVLGTQIFETETVIHVRPQSVWGKYDVGAVIVQVIGPDGTRWTPPDVTQPLRYHEHSPRDPRGGAGPVDRAFLIATADLATGAYLVTAQAHDLSDGATATAQGSFKVEPAKGSPAMGPAAVVAAVALALLACRRR